MKHTTSFLIIMILLNTQFTLKAQDLDPSLIKSTLEAQTQCDNFVRYDKQALYLGFGQYRRAFEEPRDPIPGKLRVAPFDGTKPFELITLDSAIDMITIDHQLYILTYSSIEHWDLKKKKRIGLYSTTYLMRRGLLYKEHPTSWARYKNTLIISHGRLGVTFFDLEQKKISNHIPLTMWQSPEESMATDIMIKGDKAIVLMDNFTLSRPQDGIHVFRGLIQINLKTQKVEKEMIGLDPGATSLAADSKKVVISFGGRPLWKYNLQALLRDRTLPPIERNVWSFPIKGHPTGKAAMDATYYYTCFSKAPRYPGDQNGRFKKVPMALSRSLLNLD